MENLNEAFMLLGVGMGTVFVILFFIIVFSNGLIRIINKYAPEDAPAQGKNKNNNSNIPAKMVAAITAAVNIASAGKASITKIERE